MLVNQLDRVTGKSVIEAAGPSTAGSIVFALAWAGLFCACAQAPLNARLPRALTEAEINHERALPPNRSDELLVVLSFSGGGVRAAALAYGVLEALARTRVPDATGTHRLLDDVTLITSVSGGSFTAAYYGLYGDRIFTDFEAGFLKRRVGRALLLRLFSPWNWPRLLWGSFGRSDLAAELYDDLLFHGATFADINDHPGPLIAIQATDVVEGTRFGFSNHWFVPICSDLSKFPVSRAVAASAAFPIVFSPLVLRNYAGSCEYGEPSWIGKALAEGPSAGRRYQNARHLHAYLDPAAHPRLYLVDGGVADNLGLHRVLDAVTNRRSLKALLRDRGIEHVRRFAFIIVNAQTPPGGRWGVANATPGLVTMLDAVSSVQVNRYNFETVELLRRSIVDWSKEYAGDGGQSIDSYVIEVSFEQLEDEKERQSFAGIPTAFDLPDAEIDSLRAVAQRILLGSRDFRRLLHDLGAENDVEREGGDQ
jgi:NTE family protein